MSSKIYIEKIRNDFTTATALFYHYLSYHIWSFFINLSNLIAFTIGGNGLFMSHICILWKRWNLHTPVHSGVITTCAIKYLWEKWTTANFTTFYKSQILKKHLTFLMSSNILPTASILNIIFEKMHCAPEWYHVGQPLGLASSFAAFIEILLSLV